MLEAAQKQEIGNLQDSDPKVNRDAFETTISRHVPFYLLIERIRIHDFHRFGLVPPNSEFREATVLGPIKLIANKGTAAVAMSSEGLRVIETGESKVKQQRPLVLDDGRFFDDESSQWVGLDEILRAVLKQSESILSVFEQSLTKIK